jgi:hypothetical protein
MVVIVFLLTHSFYSALLLFFHSSDTALNVRISCFVHCSSQVKSHDEQCVSNVAGRWFQHDGALWSLKKRTYRTEISTLPTVEKEGSVTFSVAVIFSNADTLTGSEARSCLHPVEKMQGDA